MAESKTYIVTTGHGGLRVGDSRVSLDSVVHSFHEGHSPEAIRAQYPALTLEQVYGAITHYLANRDEVDGYLYRQQQRWNEFRAQQEANPSPVMQRLRALKQTGTGANR